MRMTNTFSLAAAALAAVIGATTAQAATVITFDSSNNGQQALPGSYQPLLNGYGSDGGALGITMTWGGTNSSQQAYNSHVTDHTPGNNGLGYVGYDGGAYTNTITFDHAVTLPSFYYASYYGGNYTIEFKGFTNIGDTNPVVDIVRTYSQSTGYNWIQETGLAGYAITAFSFTGTSYKQLDDITVAAVPEPATWGMMLAGFGMMGAALRTRRRTTKLAFA